MKLRLLFLLAVTALLAACGPTEQQKADYAAVQRSGVSSAIYDKMVHGDPLSIGDVCSLSRAGVGGGVITRYIRDQGTIYTLSSNDYDRLKHAGVPSSVIDFMAQTSYPGYPYGPYPYGYPYGPYPYGPYWGPARGRRCRFWRWLLPSLALRRGCESPPLVHRPRDAGARRLRIIPAGKSRHRLRAPRRRTRPAL